MTLHPIHPQNWLRTPPAMAAALGALLLLSGCGEPSNRFEVSGSVTLDGVPLDKGGIRFSAQADQPFTTGTMIRDGKYKIPAEKGLAPGVYRIAINSADEQAAKVVVDGTPVSPDRIPEDYNLKSDKTIEVTAEGANEFAFEIKTR